MKLIKSLPTFIASPFFIGLVLTLVVTVVCSLYYTEVEQPDSMSSFFSGIQALHEKTIDWRLQGRGPRAGSDQVAILAIDDQSISEIGRWPWSRDKIASIVEQLKKYGAKVVAFDIVFSEKDQSSAGPALEKLEQNLKQKKLNLPMMVFNTIDQEVGQYNGDQKFADTIHDFGDHIVLGAFSEADDDFEPFQEPCLDLYFQQSSEFRNWDRESLPLVVNDNPPQLPDSIVPILTQHLHTIALTRIASWIKSYPVYVNPAREVVEKAIGAAVSDEVLAQVFWGWLHQDTALLKATLAPLKGNLQDKDLQALSLALNNPMSNLRSDLLEQSILEDQNTYCHAFLTDQDPLLRQFENAWPRNGTSFASALEKIRYESLINPVKSVSQWTMNIPILQTQMKNIATFNADLDSDGVIRTNRLITRTGSKYMPSLGLKTFLVAENENVRITIQPNLKYPGHKAVTEMMVMNADTGDDLFKIPVDSTGRMVINYAGPQQMFPYLRASDLLNTNPKAWVIQRIYDPHHKAWVPQAYQVDKASFIRNKIFLFGATATGIFDMRVTPFEKDSPGVETHANVVDNLLRRDFLRVDPQEQVTMPLVILGLGLVLSFVLAKLGALPGFLVAFLSFAGIIFVDHVFLFKHGILVAIIFPLFLVLILYLFMTFYKYFTEERKKKELKGTFEKYVSPAIVAEILADPTNLELGGRKETITVFFSDVRGFTSISEKLDPKSLSDFLNSYLTPMTRIVFENKGTLDKYIGDAIMAFFGAPVRDPKHAHHACRCALAHLRKLKELQAKYEAQGLPIIDIGIGLNTGEANVGNMGSDIVRNYTVMGDTVNLASRLEGINKQYGTRIIISEYTHAEVKSAFAAREIDRVRVKGKKQPVKIYELIAEGQVSGTISDALNLFEVGYQRYQEKQWETAIECFKQALAKNPQDTVSKLYLERCSEYLQSPPSADWDGVFVMKTK